MGRDGGWGGRGGDGGQSCESGLLVWWTSMGMALRRTSGGSRDMARWKLANCQVPGGIWLTAKCSIRRLKARGVRGAGGGRGDSCGLQREAQWVGGQVEPRSLQGAVKLVDVGKEEGCCW
ncbi:hypothetical protein CLOP_g20496 [Closterium sp. NIES-67]|nr:hypothetical protein CLOP_g20496 [Closterium sp. NIES-67]